MSNFCQIETGKGIDRLKNAAGGAKALIVALLFGAALLPGLRRNTHHVSLFMPQR